MALREGTLFWMRKTGPEPGSWCKKQPRVERNDGGAKQKLSEPEPGAEAAEGMSGKKSPAEDAVGEAVRERGTLEKAILKIPFLENPSLLLSESNALQFRNIPISAIPPRTTLKSREYNVYVFCPWEKNKFLA